MTASFKSPAPPTNKSTAPPICASYRDGYRLTLINEEVIDLAGRGSGRRREQAATTTEGVGAMRDEIDFQMRLEERVTPLQARTRGVHRTFERVTTPGAFRFLRGAAHARGWEGRW